MGRARGGVRVGTALLAAVLLAGCGLLDGTGVGGPPNRTAAVDHVAAVLAAAGHDAPEIEGLVRFQCGPVDEVLGRQVVDHPVTTRVPWRDVAPVVEPMGAPLPVTEPDPAAGAPAHEDRIVVDGGDVDAAAMQRWREEGLVQFWPCG